LEQDLVPPRVNEPTFESIRPRTKRIGRVVVHLAECTSTMDEARLWAESDKEDGAVIAADRQTAGRGRNQRIWASPKGALLATLVLRDVKALPLPIVPLAAGLALARSIERLTKAPARVKWPNDVWIDGKKVAGVLLESRFVGEHAEWILVGLGVNVDVRVEELPQEVRALATSLSAWKGGHVCAPALLKIWLEQFESLLDDLRAGRTRSVLADAEARLVGRGGTMRGTGANGPIEGTAMGLGPNGELIVKTARGDELLREGDVQLLRPA
jgi:BirA family transcriptional regulator, biotin operon repressor / biotin---[acetyl-CoA-carboxylase] ligase